jgi:hypothetical protein
VPGQPRLGALRGAKSRVCCCSLLLQVWLRALKPGRGGLPAVCRPYSIAGRRPMVYAASHLCSDKPRNHDERPEMDQRLSGMSGNHRVALDANSTAIAGDATAAFARARLTDEAEIRSTNRESRYGCRRSDVVRASCASRSRTADCEREIRPCFSGSRHPDELPLSGKLIRLNRLKPWRVGRLAPIPHLEGTRGRACCS